MKAVGTGIDITPLDEVDPSEVRAVVNTAFGQQRSPEWYEWKHALGPWGRSWGLAAVDRRGVVGVRLLLPWRLRFGKHTLLANRAVEAATVPRAQGRGVFRQLNRELMRAGSADRLALMFSTPNELSRAGYHKLGWAHVGPVAHAYRLSPWANAAASWEDALDGFPVADPSDTQKAIRTGWDAASLRWRTDPRCGRAYDCATLRAGRGPNGLLYRVIVRRGLRVLCPLVAWGEQDDRAALLGGVARHERTPVLLDTKGPGGQPLGRGPGWSRGDSLLAVWQKPASDGTVWPATDAHRWRTTMADLESVL